MVHGTILPPLAAALIWLDRAHALVARARNGKAHVTTIRRELDSEAQYLLRVAHEADDCDRLVITGSDAARVAFERGHVSVYRQPERLIDGGAEVEPGPVALVDRLRLLALITGGVA